MPKITAGLSGMGEHAGTPCWSAKGTCGHISVHTMYIYIYNINLLIPATKTSQDHLLIPATKTSQDPAFRVSAMVLSHWLMNRTHAKPHLFFTSPYGRRKTSRKARRCYCSQLKVDQWSLTYGTSTYHNGGRFRVPRAAFCHRGASVFGCGSKGGYNQDCLVILVS